MSIESITARIKKEAQAYSDDRKQEAEAAKREGLDEAKVQADRLLQKFSAEAEQDAEVLISRRKSVADLDARKMKLAAKQDVIDESYQAALDRILNLSPAEYVNFIMAQLDEYKDEGGEVLVSRADRDKHGADLINAFAGTALRLSEETANIKGGCILRRGKISYNASVERLLDNAKKELTSEIAGILFK